MYDAAEGEWSVPPAFPSGAGGLVSTVDDYAAFAAMLLAGGRGPGGRVLSRAAVGLMTTDHLTAAQRAAGPSADGSQGWGFGLAVQAERTQLAGSVGSYGWNGGLGTSWTNDPAEGLTTILLTNQVFTSAALPAVHQDAATLAAAAAR